MKKNTEQTTKVVYKVSGNNARVNINSVDISENVVNDDSLDLFKNLFELVKLIDDADEKLAVSKSIDAMKCTKGTNEFTVHYKQFMSTISDHITVFAPVLPALAELLVQR